MKLVCSICVLFLLLGFGGFSPVVEANQTSGTKERVAKMDPIDELKKKLGEGDWDAAPLAKKMGDVAWPVVEEAFKAGNEDTRQTAVVCADVLGGPRAATILKAALKDSSENVVLTAARQLSEGRVPSGSEEDVLQALESGLPEDIRELLALAAGYIPGEASINVLQKYSGNRSELGQNARMALAKLGNDKARQSMISDLSAKEAVIRYEVVGQLRYVADKSLADFVKPLMKDRADARIVGPERARRMRRVCDQALDTLTSLLKLQLPFATALDKRYSDQELDNFIDILDNKPPKR